MFGELPKLLDKNFALGYFLPGTIYLVATIYFLDKLDIYANLISRFQENLLVGTTTIGLVSWLLGIFLLGANRSIYRLLEGYGRFNPLRILLGIEKRKYTRLVNELEALDTEYKILQDKEESIPAKLRIKRNHLMQRLVERFPDNPDWILPTSFGNTIRAFEVYPRVVYGIESIQGWIRLLAVIPKDYRTLIDDGKSQVDMWVNFGLLSFAFLTQYTVLSILYSKAVLVWLPLVTFLLMVITALRAENAAIQWGELVKASFDVFLPKLKKEMELIALPENERKLWTQFSQTIIYRIPPTIPKIIEKSNKNDKNIST